MERIVKGRVATLPPSVVLSAFYLAVNMGSKSLDDLLKPSYPSSDHDRKHLGTIYKHALTALMSDSAQTEYLSDYCLMHVKQSNKETGTKSTVNPNGSRSFFRDINGKTYEFVLGLTEDQRQIMTGDGYVNTAVSDDCETLASLLLAIDKSSKYLNRIIQEKCFIKDRFDEKLATELWDEFVDYGQPVCFEKQDTTLPIKLMHLVNVVHKNIETETKLVIGDAGNPSMGGEFCMPFDHPVLCFPFFYKDWGLQHNFFFALVLQKGTMQKKEVSSAVTAMLPWKSSTTMVSLFLRSSADALCCLRRA